jgi:nicotinate-nucleotide pyrophosphorylase (carboxylating)
MAFPSLRQRLLWALEEDRAFEDITTARTVPRSQRATARLLAKAPGVLAGTQAFKTVFALVDKKIEIGADAEDGARVRPGQVVARLAGPLGAILRGERLALNLLCHLSGVATATAACVAAAKGTRTVILDTRKTTPLWRDLEREAVRAGGGQSHRRDLADMILVKDNHADAAGGMDKALERLFGASEHGIVRACERTSVRARRRVDQSRPRVIVEVRNLDELRAALNHPIDVVLLDNMDRRAIARALRVIGGRALAEVSGGVRPRDIGPLARLGVDRISLGWITHSAPALDFSLRVNPPPGPPTPGHRHGADSP